MTAIDVSAIPRPRYRFPVLGDVLAIDFVRPVQGLTAEIHKAGDHIFEERLLNVSITAVADTALIDEVNNEAVWEKHNGRLIGKLRPLGGDGLFTAFNDEPNWQRAHNILSPAFVKSAMMRYHHAMVAAVGEFVDTWTSHAADGSWVDVSTFTNRLATEVIARAGLSHSFDSAGGARVWTRSRVSCATPTAAPTRYRSSTTRSATSASASTSTTPLSFAATSPN